MKTYAHLWLYIAEISLEWEMFQTKILKQIENHILCSVMFFRKSCRFWDNVENVVGSNRPQMTIIIQRNRFAW
jgi:GH35 family endo-1,4-beta-xylanase